MPQKRDSDEITLINPLSFRFASTFEKIKRDNVYILKVSNLDFACGNLASSTILRSALSALNEDVTFSFVEYAYESAQFFFFYFAPFKCHTIYFVAFPHDSVALNTFLCAPALTHTMPPVEKSIQASNARFKFKATADASIVTVPDVDFYFYFIFSLCLFLEKLRKKQESCSIVVCCHFS